VQVNLFLLSILLSVGYSLLSICFALAIFTNKQILTKFFLSLNVFILFCSILIFILQKTGFFLMIKDAEAFRKYLQTSGAWMSYIYILLQYLQVVILPIPGIVSTIAGVALFGPFMTTIYSCLGIILGSITAFIIGRKLGNKAVAWIIGKEEFDKWRRKLKGKDNLFLSVMFIMPFFPDDILCFLAGLSSMSMGYFLSIISVSRIVAISATCYSFNLIPLNTWWGITIWVIFLILFIVGITILYKNMDKIQKWLKNRKKKQKK
jgi:uncharacterized membrane protein YdjX (TVP38/TMEM64 family)